MRWPASPSGFGQLVEGHPEKVTQFFSMHGVDQPITKAFDWPLDYFMTRYHRWRHEIN